MQWTYSFLVAFDPTFEVIWYAVSVNVHLYDKHLVVKENVALFVVVNVRLVLYENVVLETMLELHYKNVDQLRLSIFNTNKNHKNNKLIAKFDFVLVFTFCVYYVLMKSNNFANAIIKINDTSLWVLWTMIVSRKNNYNKFV